jgi:pyruvate/2-oxoglutarate dehydrogenase complex dihydrolipoamide acyltransferase (E2) component
VDGLLAAVVQRAGPEVPVHTEIVRYEGAPDEDEDDEGSPEEKRDPDEVRVVPEEQLDHPQVTDPGPPNPATTPKAPSRPNCHPIL